MAEPRKFRKVERGDFINLGKTEDEDGKLIMHVEGEWVDGDTINYPDGPVGRYTLRSDDGDDVKLFGSVILDEYFQKAQMGDYVSVTLLPSGQKTAAGRQMKDYDFQIAE